MYLTSYKNLSLSLNLNKNYTIKKFNKQKKKKIISIYLKIITKKKKLSFKGLKKKLKSINKIKFKKFNLKIFFKISKNLIYRKKKKNNNKKRKKNNYFNNKAYTL